MTYLPFTISSDAGYADLPLALFGAPVSIGALLEPGSRSPGAEPQDRDWSGRPLGTGPNMYPFGLIGVAPYFNSIVVPVAVAARPKISPQWSKI